MPFEVDIPQLGESVNEVTVLEWLCADGDYVDKDEPICVLETDKANVDLPAPTSGVLRQLRKVDDILSGGDGLAQSEEGERPADSGNGAGAEEAVPEAAGDARDEEAADDGDDAAAADLSELSPAVRRLVEENDLDPTQIQGTGREGRLIKQDILALLMERERDARDAAAAPAPRWMCSTSNRCPPTSSA